MTLTLKDPSADSSPEGANLQARIGGSGGTGNHGGAVTVTNSGAIHTRGAKDRSGSTPTASVAAGATGMAKAGTRRDPKIPFTDQVKAIKNLAINVGGSEGATGDGGAVTVTHSVAT